SVEPMVRQLNECIADARRSLSVLASFLDARFVAGDKALFEEFTRRVLQPLRRDRTHLKQRFAADIQRRHAAHPAATSSITPDVVDGRGGLQDGLVLRWLGVDEPRLSAAHAFLVETVAVSEELHDQPSHRLTPRAQEHVAAALKFADTPQFMAALYEHA